MARERKGSNVDNDEAIAAWRELSQEQTKRHEALQEKSDAEHNMQFAADSREWSDLASEFARANAQAIRAEQRIRILIGRIHFYSQTV